MDYGTPKILPTTGGAALIAGSVTGQLFAALLITITIFTIAIVVRYAWRRNQNIGE